MVANSPRLKQASKLRFVVMALGTVALSTAAAKYLGFWQGASQALFFNASAYLGLRWPLLRSALKEAPLEDRLSWSGALAGAAIGLIPSGVLFSRYQTYFAADALTLLATYYTFGKATCWFLGCCNYGSVALVERLRVIPLPLVESAVAFAVAFTIWRLDAIHMPELACSIFVCTFGLLRSTSRALREPSKITEALQRFDAAPCFCVGAALIIFTLKR